MKSLTLKIACLFISFGMLTASCKKKSEKTQKEIEKNIQSGTWNITKFIDSGQDETSHFSGYNFTFGDSGALNSTNGTNTYNGTWSISKSNSNDDNNGNDLDFNIYFNLTNNFEDLNDDWDILSHSKNKIELIDVSGGNGGTDYLTFEKK